MCIYRRRITSFEPMHIALTWIQTVHDYAYLTLLWISLSLVTGLHRCWPSVFIIKGWD